MKAAEVTTGSASNKVVSFSQPPGMDKMESLLILWIDGCTKCGVPFSYLILKKKSVFLISKTTLYMHYFYFIQAVYLLYYSCLYYMLVLF